MPFISDIGEAVETHGEMFIEWKIKNFLQLSEKADDFYHSPVFSYSDCSWHLIVYPYGQTRNQSVGWLDLYLARKDPGPPKSVSFTLRIRNLNKELSLKREFSNSQSEFGELKFWSRPDLLKSRDTLMPSNVLSIHCKLKCDVPNAVGTSLSSRLRKVSHNLQSILSDRKSADFTLRCKGREWPVHRMILGSRCEYFETMFRHDWMETSAGEVKFSDIDEDALDSVLQFIYTGHVEDLSVCNVSSVYVTAHLLLLRDLEELCIEHMKRNMGTEVVCDALEVAHTYEEEDLKEHSMEFFVANADELLDKEEWKQLKEKNPSLVLEVLEKTASTGAKKIKLSNTSELSNTSGVGLQTKTSVGFSNVFIG